MKKALFAFSLFLSFLAAAQEIRTISFNEEQLKKSEITLSTTWTSDIINKSLSIYNGNISNRANGNTGGLKLEYYLAPEEINLSKNQFTAYFIAQTPINNINSNTSMVGVAIRTSVQNLPPDGIYYPVLILTSANGRILDIYQMDGIVEIENNAMHKLNIVQADVPAAPITPVEQNIPQIVNTKEISTTTNMAGVTDINKPVKVTVRLDKHVVFENEWKIEIDYKNFMVNLTGGDIANNTNQDSENLIVDVYFTTQKEMDFSNNFDGILIASSPVDPVGKQMKLRKVSIKTNLRAIPPQGTYYIVIALSEMDEAGKPAIKSFRTYDNPQTL